MITIINDSRDENAKGRQIAKVHRLFQAPTSFIGVTDDIEAGGNLIDILDAYHQTPSVILGNVAPRNGTAKQWENGTPFGYFWYGQTLVMTTIDGYILSLVKKLGLISPVYVLDLPATLQQCETYGFLTLDERHDIAATQFRSLQFSPLAASVLWQGYSLPSTPWDISSFPDLAPCVWWIDNFGNVKTTLLRSDLSSDETSHLQTWWGDFPVYPRLKDVPEHDAGFVTGSSGLGQEHFMEFVGQGFHAASSYYISIGDPLKSEYPSSLI